MFSLRLNFCESYVAVTRILLKPCMKTTIKNRLLTKSETKESSWEVNLLETWTRLWKAGSHKLSKHNPRRSCGQKMHWVVVVGWRDQEVTLVPEVMDNEVGLLGGAEIQAFTSLRDWLADCRLYSVVFFSCPWNFSLKLSISDGSVVVETAVLPESGLRNSYT